ncbi:unnamed protein product [Brassica oleracea]|uniref:(rape) hypothetical protein n=1 Tax=Brassica napus TaxID=3708 RepID=A0A816UE84_BRANA|nr:unnamed protein product [Brassica napus]
MRSGFSSGARDAPFQTFLAKGKLKRTWDMDSISLHLRHRLDIDIGILVQVCLVQVCQRVHTFFNGASAASPYPDLVE